MGVDLIQILVSHGIGVKGMGKAHTGTAGSGQLAGHRHHGALRAHPLEPPVEIQRPEMGVKGGDLLHFTW